MTKNALASRLTVVARDAFENGAIYVEELLGALYLSSSSPITPRRRFRFVGIPKQGLRRLTETIRRIAKEY